MLVAAHPSLWLRRRERRAAAAAATPASLQSSLQGMNMEICRGENSWRCSKYILMLIFFICNFGSSTQTHVTTSSLLHGIQILHVSSNMHIIMVCAVHCALRYFFHFLTLPWIHFLRFLSRLFKNLENLNLENLEIRTCNFGKFRDFEIRENWPF